MKKLLMMMSVFAIGLGANAQITTNSSCDTNLNGTVSIEDVTNVANKVIGKAAEEKEVVTAEQVNATLERVNKLLNKIDNDHQEVLDRLRSLEEAGLYTSDYVNGHKYVDLGLPSGTLWATCNVGASSPEEYGDYFAWGETKPQADNAYSWASYKWSNGGTSSSNPNLTKYCKQSSYGYNGFTDTLTELESADDAATVNWGSDWQMPSETQQAELRNNCYWEWVTSYNGNSVKGCIVYKAKSDSDKGKYKNSGSSTTTSASYSMSDVHIFLPAAGYRYNGSLNQAGSSGNNWSLSLSTTYSDVAYDLYFDWNCIDCDGSSRCYGRSVRPVRVATK